MTTSLTERVEGYATLFKRGEGVDFHTYNAVATDLFHVLNSRVNALERIGVAIAFLQREYPSAPNVQQAINTLVQAEMCLL